MRRILFVSRHYASDFSNKVGGVFQRMRMLLDAAAAAADKIDILFFADNDLIARAGPAPAQASLAAHWGITATVHLAPRAVRMSGRLATKVRSMLRMEDQDDYFRFSGKAQIEAIAALASRDTSLIVAHRLYVGPAAVAAAEGIIPVVMDLDDIEHRNLLRQLRRPPRSLSRLLLHANLPALFHGELRTLRACTTSFVCSREDRAYLATRGVHNIDVVPNAIRFESVSEPSSPPPSDTLFFIGTYGYRPNADAAEYLIRSIFPLVLDAMPEAHLLIVGEAIEKLPSHAAPPRNVEFRGFVPDLREVYDRASVVCCPVLAGGGTRIKIIEAAARFKAVVSTTVGAEGLGFVDGYEIVLRDSAASFAAACVDLLKNPEKAAAIGYAAYIKGRSLYDRSKVVADIAHLFGEAARR